LADNDPVADLFKDLWYLQSALKGKTEILGGLILSSILQLGNYRNGSMERVTAGVSGVTSNPEIDVAFWGGGTLQEAIKAVKMFKDNPSYQPTEEEVASIAKAVITHGGRAILNDIVLRGYIYALGGVFNGTVYAKDGIFNGTVYAKDGIFNGTVYAKDGIFNGTIQTTSGVFGGDLYQMNEDGESLNMILKDGSCSLGSGTIIVYPNVNAAQIETLDIMGDLGQCPLRHQAVDSSGTLYANTPVWFNTSVSKVYLPQVPIPYMKYTLINNCSNVYYVEVDGNGRNILCLFISAYTSEAGTSTTSLSKKATTVKITPHSVLHLMFTEENNEWVFLNRIPKNDYDY
jgi:hypothetical protein